MSDAVDDEFKINNDLLIQGLKFWFPKYENMTDEEILADYDMQCVRTMCDMKARGDERLNMIEDTLHNIREKLKDAVER